MCWQATGELGLVVVVVGFDVVLFVLVLEMDKRGRV